MKKGVALFLIIIVILLVLIFSVNAWQKTNNPSSGTDDATAIAADSSGIYIAGYDSSLGSSNTEWRIEKRNKGTGNLIWSQTSNPSSGNDQATAIAVDSSGLYIVGIVGSQGRIEKRDLTTGNLIWSHSSTYSINAIAVDSSGFYIAESNGRFEKRDLTTGNLIWYKTSSIPGLSAIKIDSSGIYLSGSTSNEYSWKIEKRDLTGTTVLWTQSGSPWYIDEMAVDSSGLYLTGSTADTYSYWKTEKRNLSTGNIIWTKNFESPYGNDVYGNFAEAISVDSTGVYIAGSQSFDGVLHFDWRIEKRNLNTGDIIWVNSTSNHNIGNNMNSAYSIISYSNTVYAAGYSQVSEFNYQWKILSLDASTGKEPSCTDGIKNQDETGIDCGGSACTACPSAPTVNVGGPYVKKRNAAFTITGTAVDYDGTISSLSWGATAPVGCTQIQGAATGLGTASASRILTLTCTTTGAKQATLTATDNSGLSSLSTAQITINLNNAPSVNAGGHYTENVNQNVILTGTATDSDGNINTISWNTGPIPPGCTQTQGVAVGTGSPSASRTLTLNCNSAISGPITLTATDNDALSSSDQAQVTISSPPIVDAGGSYTGIINEPLTIIGIATDENGISTLVWDGEVPAFCTFTSQDTIINGNSASKTAILTCSEPAAGTITLKATDNTELYSTDNAGIVIDNAGICGDSSPDTGEECDDGNTVSGDGCSADCQIEIRAYWLDANGNYIDPAATPLDVVAGVKLKMYLDHTSLSGSTDFEILEQDDLIEGAADDTVKTISGTADGSIAEAEWTLTHKDLTDMMSGTGDEEELEVYFKVDGQQSETIIIRPFGCDFISLCSEYDSPESCERDLCGIADDNLGDYGIDCSSGDCSCILDPTEGCKPNYDLPSIGACTFTSGSNNLCENGLFTYSWTSLWNWDDLNVGYLSETECESVYAGECTQDTVDLLWYSNPINPLTGETKSESCTDGERVIPCPAQMQLPFFGVLQVVAVIIIIFLIYLILKPKKKNSEKNTFKKTARKKVGMFINLFSF
jgi:cysteine-rich repeat protein